MTNLMLCRDESREPACSAVTRTSSACVQRCDCTNMGILGSGAFDFDDNVREETTASVPSIPGTIISTGRPGLRADRPGKTYHYI